jgi:hypothetical protein
MALSLASLSCLSGRFWLFSKHVALKTVDFQPDILKKQVFNKAFPKLKLSEV